VLTEGPSAKRPAANNRMEIIDLDAGRPGPHAAGESDVGMR
jgi:hypothetical protein